MLSFTQFTFLCCSWKVHWCLSLFTTDW